MVVLQEQLAEARAEKARAELAQLCDDQRVWLEKCTAMGVVCKRVERALTAKYERIHDQRRAVTDGEKDHVRRLEQAAATRHEASRTSLATAVRDAITTFGKDRDAAVASAQARRRAAVDEASRLAEFYGNVAAGTGNGPSQQTANAIASTLGRFQTAYRELCDAHDRADAAQVGYMCARLLYECQNLYVAQ